LEADEKAQSFAAMIRELEEKLRAETEARNRVEAEASEALSAAKTKLEEETTSHSQCGITSRI
jgi:hypothetical protein